MPHAGTALSTGEECSPAGVPCLSLGLQHGHARQVLAGLVIAGTLPETDLSDTLR